MIDRAKSGKSNVDTGSRADHSQAQSINSTETSANKQHSDTERYDLITLNTYYCTNYTWRMATATCRN